MNQAASNYDNAAEQVEQLTRVRFVFHAWQDLIAVDANGMKWNLDAKRLDVEKGIGTTFLKRLQLLPITATQAPSINNKEGFSVSNMFVGARDGSDKPVGFGSGMQGSHRTNVEGKWAYPEQKITDMLYTYGRYGLVGFNSLSAQTPDEERLCRDIFDIVMSGIPANALLEDLPEYFAEEYLGSEYLPEKKPFGFRANAYDIIDKGFSDGVTIGNRQLKLPAAFYDKADTLIKEIEVSILQAQRAALDSETGGILPMAKDMVAKKQKRSFDKCDAWFMRQFPSYPMDTEAEKANKQIIRALDAGNDAAPVDYAPNSAVVPLEVYQQLKEQNDGLMDRLARIETLMSAPAAPATEESKNSDATGDTGDKNANQPAPKTPNRPAPPKSGETKAPEVKAPDAKPEAETKGDAK